VQLAITDAFATDAAAQVDNRKWLGEHAGW
jgi:hypothetical protein